MKGKEAEEELKLLKESGYSDKAIELYLNKVNVGMIENPDVVETYIGPCGDLIKLFLSVDEHNVINDAKFQSLGCPGVATSASAVTSLLKGKPVEEAKKITEEDVFHELGGLPEPKMDCVELVLRGLKRAIADFEKSRPSDSEGEPNR